MGLFLFAATGLVAFTLLLLLRPWQRRTEAHEASRGEVNAGIYRDQLAELDRDLAAGTLAAADHAQAREELQRRVLQDTGSEPAPSAQAAGARRTMLLLAIALPLAATGLYGALGEPAALLPQPQAAAEGAHQATAADIEQMVAKLAARLEKNPDDLPGWAMLARSYHATGRMAQAQAVFARLGDKVNEDPALLADYADVLAAQAGGSLEGRPLELVTAALRLDPDHAMSLSLAATAAYKRGDFPEAARHWQRLLAQLPPGSEDARWLQNMLADIGAPPPAQAAAPAGKAVSGTVSLSPGLAGQARPTDTVFVFARATDGSRAPLAVQRARVSDLPLAFRLDDSMAMSPQHKLSEAKEFRIEARISRSGNATPAAGDLIGASAPVGPGADRVVLTIDTVRP